MNRVHPIPFIKAIVSLGILPKWPATPQFKRVHVISPNVRGKPKRTVRFLLYQILFLEAELSPN